MLTFPSDAAPPLPSFSIEPPPGWEPHRVPGALLALAEPVTTGEFRANLTASANRLALDASLEAVALELLSQERARYTDLEVSVDEPTDVDGHPAWVRLVAFSAQPAVTVVQVQLLILVDGDLIQMYATCGANHAKDKVETMRASLASVKVAGAFRGPAPDLRVDD